MATESVAITDPELLLRYTRNPRFPFLVSFPRTGSHWLRMLMELYFGRPSLIRVFYYLDRTNYLCLHSHDMPGSGLPEGIGDNVLRRNVIYLYRDPVDTIYSQLCYCHDNLSHPQQLESWTMRYADHLHKWLHDECFSTAKTVLTYEALRRNLESEFSRVASHFGEPLETERLREAAERVSREEVERRTTYDQDVIQKGQSYEEQREVFRERYASHLWEILLGKHPHLAKDFARLPKERC